jgi:hypothetical protein
MSNTTKFRRKNHPLVHTYENMRERCTNPNNHNYPRYGGRGISVCEEWKGKGGFQRFVEYVGEKPTPIHTLDRINNDGNYEPGNVRWATPQQQASNRTYTRPKYTNPKRKTTPKDIPGVTYEKSSNRWVAKLSINNKFVLHRAYQTQDEAIAVRRYAESVFLNK